jgi:hypothetical protein
MTRLLVFPQVIQISAGGGPSSSSNRTKSLSLLMTTAHSARAARKTSRSLACCKPTARVSSRADVIGEPSLGFSAQRSRPVVNSHGAVSCTGRFEGIGREPGVGGGLAQMVARGGRTSPVRESIPTESPSQETGSCDRHQAGCSLRTPREQLKVVNRAASAAGTVSSSAAVPGSPLCPDSATAGRRGRRARLGPKSVLPACWRGGRVSGRLLNGQPLKGPEGWLIVLDCAEVSCTGSGGVDRNSPTDDRSGDFGQRFLPRNAA